MGLLLGLLVPVSELEKAASSIFLLVLVQEGLLDPEERLFILSVFNLEDDC